jgi:hypothetical protein
VIIEQVSIHSILPCLTDFSSLEVIYSKYNQSHQTSYQSPDPIRVTPQQHNTYTPPWPMHGGHLDVFIDFLISHSNAHLCYTRNDKDLCDTIWVDHWVDHFSAYIYQKRGFYYFSRYEPTGAQPLMPRKQNWIS